MRTWLQCFICGPSGSALRGSLGPGSTTFRGWLKAFRREESQTEAVVLPKSQKDPGFVPGFTPRRAFW